jgi:methionyl-tRNA formyltransferase
LAALAVRDPAGDPLAAFARSRGVRVVDQSGLLQDIERSPGQAGWLLNANSTLIVPERVLRLFEGRSLNFHPGLLPEYAGLHTHQWAIRNGEREFGVTVHRMAAQVDAGAVVGEVRFPITPDDTGLSVFRRCLAAGAELFPRIVRQILRGEPLADIAQDLARRRLYRHRDALDGRVDWNDTAERIVAFVRAGNYEPFASPTYVARLDPVPGFDVEVLRATSEPASSGQPGAVVDVSSVGPLIACVGGGAVRIVRARSGTRVMTLPLWRDYLSQLRSARLLGRAEDR